MKIKKIRKIPRNATAAIAAISGLKAGPMKHRLQPKSGSSNEHQELLEEYMCPTCSKPYDATSFCSDSFHNCIDCEYEEGKIKQLCSFHSGEEECDS